MTTKVHSYLGGLNQDVTNKFEMTSNATVTVGNGTTTGNIHTGGNLAIGNISPRANALAVGGDVTVSGTIDIGIANITNDLSLSGGDGALRFPIASSIKVLDNSATSLVIEEADTAYVTIVTTDGSEAIKFDKALDINAAVQLDATLTVGANDQGYDVILYGDTASANMTWDTSADDLIFNGAAGLVVPDGQFTLGSTAVTSNASELNLLDGVSGLVQADFTKLAAITSSATEINLLDAITRGSIIYGNASAASARLAKGAEGTVLTAGADDISWAAAAEAGVGYTNSSTSTVPGTTNTDLGNLTDASEDAFGIQSTPVYDLMDPIGSLVSLDLGAF
tara:strand:+ start:813 stop:1823 length:1011 start_codon:yes stop_codon:yes gene_type:complete